MPSHSKLHFIGVGGSGMSALAQLLAASGVSGSDRAWPAQDPVDLFAKLQKQGVTLFPQDGSGVTAQTGRVVVSTAIEKDNPDLEQAQKLGIETIHRSDLLAELANREEAVAVSGTSGKSTICGMTGVLFEETGLAPTVVNGGEILNFVSETHTGNVRRGDGKWFVIEADESDGTLVKYFPRHAVVSNISKDHKSTEELEKLFLQLARQTRGTLIVNADCPNLSKIVWPAENILRYGMVENAEVQATDVELSAEGSFFFVDDVRFDLQVPGLQNVSNALAAIAAGIAAGIPLKKMPPALAKFKGIHRRLERVARRGEFQVYDDYAHNPDKIRASLRTLIPHCRRLVAVFQPHGYGPTRFLFDDYAQTFREELRDQDRLYFLPIFDAGGTADRTISSTDLAGEIAARGHKKTAAVSSREELLRKLEEELQSADTVIVMGARDPSLTPLSRAIAQLAS